QEESVERQTRELRRLTRPSSVRTSAMRRTTGSFCSRGARTKLRVVQALWRVDAQKHVMPPSAIVLALRAECWTCLRERQYGRRVVGTAPRELLHGVAVRAAGATVEQASRSSANAEGSTGTSRDHRRAGEDCNAGARRARGTEGRRPVLDGKW